MNTENIKKLNYKNCMSSSIEAMGTWVDEEWFDWNDKDKNK